MTFKVGDHVIIHGLRRERGRVTDIWDGANRYYQVETLSGETWWEPCDRITPVPPLVLLAEIE